MRAMAIGELSKRTAVKIPTIRYYEEIGLLAPPARTNSNRRAYGGDDVSRIRFIRHARALGFEIEAIRQLLALACDRSRSCAEVDAIARTHLTDIDARIARLAALRTEVARMVDQCARGSIGECRVIEVLGDHSLCAADHPPPAAGLA